MIKDGVSKIKPGLPDKDTDKSLSSIISKVNQRSPTYIIAEIGFNHMGNFELAKKMVYGAKKAGVDAVKFQTFIPGEMVFKKSIHYNLINGTSLNFDQYKKLKIISKKLKLDFFSTAFDLQSFQLLNKLNVDCIKIASMDLNNFHMFDYLKKFNKTILLSTGMSSYDEIKNSYSFLKKFNKNIFLLHCISNYPTREEDAKLGFIKKLKNISEWKVGYSDHTLGNESASLAVGMGSKIIEKHFTIDNKLKGADNKDSLNTSNMSKFVNRIRSTEKIIETFKGKLLRPDMAQKIYFRRFIFARSDIKKGEKISNNNIICLRSQNKKIIGVDKYFKILNKKAKKNIKKNEPILIKNLK